MIAGILAITSFALAGPAFGICPYDLNCINNPYGAGNPYKADGLMNPYSPYGSPYSNRSWTNPFATEPPKIYDRDGNYRGRLSTNPFHPDSISNPFGRYGNPYSYENLMRRAVVDNEGQQVHVMSAVGHDSKHCYTQKKSAHCR